MASLICWMAAACGGDEAHGGNPDLERVKLQDMMSSPIVTLPLLPGGPAGELVPIVGTTQEDAVVSRGADLAPGSGDAALATLVPRLISQGVTFTRLTCAGGQVSFQGETDIRASWRAVKVWPAEVDVYVSGRTQKPSLQLRVVVGSGTQLGHYRAPGLSAPGCPPGYVALATKAPGAPPP